MSLRHPGLSAQLLAVHQFNGDGGIKHLASFFRANLRQCAKFTHKRVSQNIGQEIVDAFGTAAKPKCDTINYAEFGLKRCSRLSELGDLLDPWCDIDPNFF